MTTDVAIPAVSTFTHIVERAKSRVAGRKPRAALVAPNAPNTALAFARAAHDGLIDPLVIGIPDRARELLLAHDFEFTDDNLISVADSSDAVARAADLIDDGKVDLLVQGGVRPAPFLTALFDASHKFRLHGRTISHVAVIRPQSYPKLLLLTDSAVIVTPDLTSKLNLLGNLAVVARAVGIDRPRVAVLAAVEAVYPQMQATLDGAVLAKMCERGQIKGMAVDGPLSFDVAVDIKAAHAKGVTTSEVAGHADGLLAPNIEVANGIYNAMTLYGRAEIGGVLVGGRVPVAMHSRADNADARYHSITLAVLMAT